MLARERLRELRVRAGTDNPQRRTAALDSGSLAVGFLHARLAPQGSRPRGDANSARRRTRYTATTATRESVAAGAGCHPTWLPLVFTSSGSSVHEVLL